jgi:hypothetical protein
LLPRPWAIKDMHGKTVRYRVIAWLPISQRDTFNWDQGAEGQGVWLSLLSNVNDIDDYWTGVASHPQRWHHRQRDPRRVAGHG